MHGISLRTRHGKAVAAIAAGAASLALVGTGVATAAAPTKPAAPKAGTQNLGAYTRVVGTTVSLAAGGFASSIVGCPAGQVALGGGESNSALGTLVLTDSWPISTTAWLVWVKSSDAGAQSFTAYVLCGV
jgi:hypothetical protein